MDLVHVNVGSYCSWILKVLQSFFQLLRYFFHVFRPIACIILDAEKMKSNVMSLDDQRRGRRRVIVPDHLLKIL